MMHCVDCARKVRVLERWARLSRLALPEMQRLFRVSGLFSYRDRVNEGYRDRGNHFPVTFSPALLVGTPRTRDRNQGLSG